jgi:hypothetical protein
MPFNETWLFTWLDNRPINTHVSSFGVCYTFSNNDEGCSFGRNWFPIKLPLQGNEIKHAYITGKGGRSFLPDWHFYFTDKFTHASCMHGTGSTTQYGCHCQRHQDDDNNVYVTMVGRGALVPVGEGYSTGGERAFCSHHGRSNLSRVPHTSPSAKNRALGEELHSGKMDTRKRKVAFDGNIRRSRLQKNWKKNSSPSA